MSIFIGDIDPDYSDNNSSFIESSLNHAAIGNLRAEIVDKPGIVEYSEIFITGISIFMTVTLFIGVCWNFFTPQHQGYDPIPERAGNRMPPGAIPITGGIYVVPR